MKSLDAPVSHQLSFVSALAAEWIEIARINTSAVERIVSALAAEWIEISYNMAPVRLRQVSALAAEWIEMF